MNKEKQRLQGTKRLPISQRSEIGRLYCSGEKERVELAEMYQCSLSTIHKCIVEYRAQRRKIESDISIDWKKVQDSYPEKDKRDETLEEFKARFKPLQKNEDEENSQDLKTLKKILNEYKLIVAEQCYYIRKLEEILGES